MKLKFTRVDLILLLMVIFWGANISIIKVTLKHFDPVVFNCLRFVIAAGTMLILYRRVFDDPVHKKELFSLLLLGVLGNTIYQFFFIYGVNYTQATHVSILLGTTPIFTAGLSSSMGFERVKKQSWLGVFLSFLGILLIVFGGGDLQAGTLHGNIGDLFVVLASFVWSIYTTFSRKVIHEYSSQHYIVYTVIFGTLFLVPVSLPAFRHQDWSMLGAPEWGALLYSAFLALVFGYSAWYYGVQKIGSTRTSAYSNLTPVAGLAIGMIFLGERLSALQWLGAFVIFIGLLLNRFTEKEIVDASLTK